MLKTILALLVAKNAISAGITKDNKISVTINPAIMRLKSVLNVNWCLLITASSVLENELEKNNFASLKISSECLVMFLFDWLGCFGWWEVWDGSWFCDASDLDVCWLVVGLSVDDWSWSVNLVPHSPQNKSFFVTDSPQFGQCIKIPLVICLLK